MTAAITAPLVKQGKKILILSNEEAVSDVRARVSCLLLGLSFGYLKSGKMPKDKIERIANNSEEIQDQLKVIGNQTELDRRMTTNASGIEQLLEKISGQVDLVILDYFQNVTKHDELPGAAQSHETQERLTTALDRIKQTIGCPIVVMAQCLPIDKRKNGEETVKGFEAHSPFYRSRGSRQIFFAATEIIECVKDFKNNRTYLFAHKSRFGNKDSLAHIALEFDKNLQTYSRILLEK